VCGDILASDIGYKALGAMLGTAILHGAEEHAEFQRHVKPAEADRHRSALNENRLEMQTLSRLGPRLRFVPS
jgi:hypothetical protein